ncbi:MAG: hypothetical protein D6718_00790 [Acidobacteria bacterium]|nr:MAG: hypothetical protein D6718_00790 [Acidobacteriota bacterium]
MDAAAVTGRRRPAVRRKIPRGLTLPVRLLLLAALVLTAAGACAWAAGLWRPADVRLRFSEPYRQLTALARRDPVVARELGGVIGFGWLPRGELHAGPRAGWCEIELWVRGDRRRGRLEARLERRGGRWFWRWANLRLPDGRLIALAVP